MNMFIIILYSIQNFLNCLFFFISFNLILFLSNFFPYPNKAGRKENKKDKEF